MTTLLGSLISRLLKSCVSTLTLQKPDLLCTSQLTILCHWFVLCTEFALTAAVAEFKGPHIHGVVRIAQVSMELVRIEASFNGLTPGLHGWSINDYGDLTRGAASTGGIFNGSAESKTTDGLVSSLLFSSWNSSVELKHFHYFAGTWQRCALVVKMSEVQLNKKSSQVWVN